MKDVVREDRRLLNIVTQVGAVLLFCCCCSHAWQLTICPPLFQFQSTLIGLIASKEFASKLGPIASKTLEELHLAGPSEVLSVSMNDSVLNAFTIIATNVSMSAATIVRLILLSDYTQRAAISFPFHRALARCQF